ncbi:hypothetical protein BC828DRAFT_412995 [Blastocladiella britannica]|nr:hypothetical protein BC828DRAFT_412995 [Blastocladiella britannica]
MAKPKARCARPSDKMPTAFATPAAAADPSSSATASQSVDVDAAPEPAAAAPARKSAYGDSDVDDESDDGEKGSHTLNTFDSYYSTKKGDYRRTAICRSFSDGMYIDTEIANLCVCDATARADWATVDWWLTNFYA